jgi:hypothetical protein
MKVYAAIERVAFQSRTYPSARATLSRRQRRLRALGTHRSSPMEFRTVCPSRPRMRNRRGADYLARSRNGTGSGACSLPRREGRRSSLPPQSSEQACTHDRKPNSLHANRQVTVISENLEFCLFLALSNDLTVITVFIIWGCAGRSRAQRQALSIPPALRIIVRVLGSRILLKYQAFAANARSLANRGGRWKRGVSNSSRAF